MPKATGPIHALGNRQFRTIWIAALLSNVGALIHIVAAAWWMTLVSASDTMVALVQSAITLPVMVMSLVAGALADSYDRRRIMMAAQLFMLVISSLLTALALTGHLTPWVLLAFTFLIGCGTALHNPAWQSSISRLVPRPDLPGAVAANSMGMNITRSVGPAIGGLIVATVGAVVAFAVNAASYLFLIYALIRWKMQPAERRLPPEGLGTAISTGLRYFVMSPNLMTCALRASLFGFGAISVQALAPLIASQSLGGDASTFGTLLAAFGIGAILGGLLSPVLRSRLRSEQVCRLTFTVTAASCMIIALSPNTVLTTVAFLLAGSCWLNTFSLINATVQMSSPQWVLGRMLSLFMTGAFGGMAAGGWVWGAVTETAGLSVALMGCAAFLVAGGLWGLWHPLPEMDDTNHDPVNRFSEPSLNLDLRKRSGPIAIQLEYRIAAEDTDEFLASMAVRRRLRVRDGARHWELLRNLEHPELWTESYHFSTWTEYVRHNGRKTRDDVENIEHLKALHRGDAPVFPRRMIKVPPSDGSRVLDGRFAGHGAAE